MDGKRSSKARINSITGRNGRSKRVISAIRRTYGYGLAVNGIVLNAQSNITKNTMKTTDNRLDREVVEMVGQTTTLTEKDLRSYRREDYDDPDHEYFESRIDDVVETLQEDSNSRRAIAVTDDEKQCMVGIHVLLRDHIHVFSWLRASDIDEYRDDDIGFLYSFGRKIRKRMGINDRIVVHLFTSTLHHEV